MEPHFYVATAHTACGIVTIVDIRQIFVSYIVATAHTACGIVTEMEAFIENISYMLQQLIPLAVL